MKLNMVWAGLLAALFSASVVAQNVDPLATTVSFNGTNGATPFSSLVQAADGIFYGATTQGGANNLGTFYRLDTNGITELFSFDATNGNAASGTLVLASNGLVYGISQTGGSNGLGQVFTITTNGVFSDLFDFNGTNGAQPYGGLTLGNDGVLYGVTLGGGTNSSTNNSGAGTIFKITLGGGFTSLFSFSNTNGSEPAASLTLGRDGNFYGTTYAGGATYSSNSVGNGTIFAMATNGTVTTLVSFNGTNGSAAQAAMVQGLDGALYGTTSGGGTNAGTGTIFKMTTNGVFTSLISFNGTNGLFPKGGLIQASDGIFYGSTFGGGTNGIGAGLGGGTLFKMTPDGTLTTLHQFSDAEGSAPQRSLFQAANGAFYGTAVVGGSVGAGSVFSLVDSGATLPLVLLGKSPGAINLTWVPLPYRNYQVRYKTDLSQATWTNLGSTVSTNTTSITVTDPVASGARFYQVVLLP